MQSLDSLPNTIKVNKPHYHICHYCFKYMTPHNSNINNHFKRKRKCPCLTLFSYDEAKDASTHKKFIFNIDTHKLTTDDLKFIGQNTFKETNVINEDYRTSIIDALKGSLPSQSISNVSAVDQSLQLTSLTNKPRHKRKNCTIDVSTLLNDDKEHLTKLLPESVIKECGFDHTMFTNFTDINTKGLLSLYSSLKHMTTTQIDKHSSQSMVPHKADLLEETKSRSEKSSVHTMMDDLSEKYKNVNMIDVIRDDAKGMNKEIVSSIIALMTKIQEESLETRTLYPQQVDLSLHDHKEDNQSDSTENDDDWAVSVRFDDHQSDDDASQEGKEKSDVSTNILLNPKDQAKNNESTLFYPQQQKEDPFKKEFYNEELNRYVCPLCNTSFTAKHNALKHMHNKKACEYAQKKDTVIEKYHTVAQMRATKASTTGESKTHNIQMIQNIGTIQNIGAINNIQNNSISNNTHNSLHVSLLRDFVHENFDITHINDSICEQRDFFLYPNFLRTIMENKCNQNIFFCGNEAIVYTDNEVSKMSSDKAGYIVMDKLSKSCSQLIQRQDEKTRCQFKHVEKYYYVVKGQYKHDTTYREYSIDYFEFFHTESGNMFRSRDKIHNSIRSILRPFNDLVRKNMESMLYDIEDLPRFDPSIEDYASTRMRNRDLKA